MAKRKDPLRLVTQQPEKASECIRKYSPHESSRKKLIAKCLRMARDNRLSPGGSYIKKGG